MLSMISDVMLLHLALAFIVGSVWVTLVTVIAERSGSTVGGVLGGLPSTSGFSFFFIGINQSSKEAVQATTVFPLAFSFTCTFLLLYAIFAKRGFRAGISLSLLIWFAISGLTVISGLENFTTSLIGCILICSSIYYIFTEKIKLKNFGGARVHPSNFQLICRAILAGSIVLLAVLLSQVGGPLLGGIFSAFPAVFISTLYVINKSEGMDFSRAMTKPLMVSGILTVIPFSVAVRYLYQILGVWLGTVGSYAVVAPLAISSYYIVKRK